MLSVLEPLVSYGFFERPSKIRQIIIKLLIDILDSNTDEPAKGMKFLIESADI